MVEHPPRRRAAAADTGWYTAVIWPCHLVKDQPQVRALSFPVVLAGDGSRR
jgi:G:T-mismatch repair DNA endonuclease (very short patch repair protein)